MKQVRPNRTANLRFEINTLPEWTAFFEQLIARVINDYTPPSELSTSLPVRLVRFASQSIALAVETVARAIDRPGLTEEALRRDALRIALNPTASRLLFVFLMWRYKHPEFHPSEKLSAPKFVLARRSDFYAAAMLLARFRLRIPVADGFLALRGGSGAEHQADSGSDPAAEVFKPANDFFKTLDNALRRTLGRHLISREGSRESDEDWDWVSRALVGTIERYHDGMESLRGDLARGGPLVALPPIPVPGMEERNRDRDGRDWSAFGTDILVQFLAGLAPVFMGVLELALPDAAKAAQRAELDQRAAMKRGGTGDRKSQSAKKEQDAPEITAISPRHKHEHHDDEFLHESELHDPTTDGPLKYETPEDIRADREFTERINASFPEVVARYFLARMELNQKQAARAAGIDPRTAREYEGRYEAALRSILGDRPPRKSR